MDKVAITIEVNPHALGNLEDSYLATLWHLAQANPAEYGDRTAGELVERISREIIRRWLRSTEPELWKHQGNAYFWNELRKHGKWIDGEFVAHAQAEDTK